jgi:ribosomal-protein-alanine N-acetyltransferase
MQIETKRFVLRDFAAADRAPFLDYQMDPHYLRLYDLNASYAPRASDLFARFLSWQQEQPGRRYQLGIFIGSLATERSAHARSASKARFGPESSAP